MEYKNQFGNAPPFYFMLDILAETFVVGNKKVTSRKEVLALYNDIKKEFCILLREYINGEKIPTLFMAQKYEVVVKSIHYVFKQYVGEDTICSLGELEFGVLEKALLAAFSINYDSKESAAFIHRSIFDLMIQATANLDSLLVKQQKEKGIFNAEAQSILNFVRLLTTHMHEIVLSKSVRGDSQIWKKLEEYAKKWIDGDMFILVWQKYIVLQTSNLVDSLGSIPEAEYKLLMDEAICPFEGYKMKKEYILQVLYNAHVELQKVSPEKLAELQAASLYQKVYGTEIYCTFDLWIRLLRVVSFPTSFSYQATITQYAKTIHGIIDSLIGLDKSTKMREGKEHAVTTTLSPPNTTIFDIFAQFLFPFCQTANNGLFLKTLCKIFCSNQSEVPIALSYVAHIMRIIVSSLNSKNINTICIVITQTKYIFTLEYKGLYMLIPYYLDQIETVLHHSDSSDKAKSACITILSSLLSVPDNMPGYTIGGLLWRKPITMEEVKNRVIGILTKLLSDKEIEKKPIISKVITKGVCCICVLIYHECLLTNPNIALCKELMAIIIEKSLHPSPDIHTISLSVLSSFGYLFHIFNALDKGIIAELFGTLSAKLSSITKMRLHDQPDLQNHALNIMRALEELVIEDRYQAFIFNKSTFIMAVDAVKVLLTETYNNELQDEANMLMEFIKEYYLNYPLRNQSTAVTGSVFMDEGEFFSLQENSLKNFHRSFKPKKRRRRSISHIISEEKKEGLSKTHYMSYTQEQPILHSQSQEEFNSEIQNEESQSGRFFDILKKESPLVMQLITGSVDKEDRAGTGTGSTPTGESAQKSALVATNARDAEYQLFFKSKTIHLAVNSQAIISIIDAPYLSSKIIVRDLVGKHGWLITEHRVLDYNFLENIDYNDKAAMYKNILNLKGDTKLKSMIEGEKGGIEEEQKKQEEEKKKELSDLLAEDGSTAGLEKSDEEVKKAQNLDLLERALQIVERNCSDIRTYKGSTQKWEKQEMGRNEKDLTEQEAKIARFEESEQFLYKLAESEHKEKQGEEFKAEMKVMHGMYKSNVKRHDHARAFLSHLGNLELLPQVAPHASGQKVVLLNETDPNLRVMLQYLDNQCSLRKSIKIGVIFVDRGQFDQRTILYNTRGSAKYDEFLDKLGKMMMRKDNTQDSGLLPDVYLYFATAITELVFHVSTLIATNFNDPHVIEKKKYLGNDSIHIVWTENEREYKAGTISGAFNFVHLIMYPLRNGLIKLRILKKKEHVTFFGPLINGMMLPLDIIPALIRYTAINARRSITFKQLKMVNPMSERRKTLEKIATQFNIQMSGIKGKNDSYCLHDKLMNIK